MPQIIFLPHAEHCPDGMVVEAETGKTILEVAHDNHIELVGITDSQYFIADIAKYYPGMNPLSRNREQTGQRLHFLF